MTKQASGAVGRLFVALRERNEERPGRPSATKMFLLMIVENLPARGQRISNTGLPMYAFAFGLHPNGGDV